MAIDWIGPSNQMGYPSWERLASLSIDVVKREVLGKNLRPLHAAFDSHDFPKVFELAKDLLGLPRLLQHLQQNFRPSHAGKIYELIAKWPIPVYLTTNFDDEIQNHLAKLSEAYLLYTNSEEHLSQLLPDLNGAIVKLHGDLRSENGLILTTSQYRDILCGDSWKYWRTKMTSIFQMNRVIVIGYSISDPNITHVLEAAKQGAGVIQPVCWISPDVTPETAREYLEKYRIRVIPYDNRDGEHKSLIRLIENISDFISPRTSVHIQEQIARISQSPLGDNAAAPGFFVFNKLSTHVILIEKGWM